MADELSLLVSGASAAIAMLSLGWNIKSQYFPPKPRVRVELGHTRFAGHGEGKNLTAIRMTITNHGPGKVGILESIAKTKNPKFEDGKTIIPCYKDFPRDLSACSGAEGRLLEQSEAIDLLFPASGGNMFDDEVILIGVADTYGRQIWADNKSFERTKLKFKKFSARK